MILLLRSGFTVTYLCIVTGKRVSLLVDGRENVELLALVPGFGMLVSFLEQLQGTNLVFIPQL